MIVDHVNRFLIGTPTKTGATSLDSTVRRGSDVPEGLEIVYWPGHGKKAHGLLVPPGCERYTRYLTVRHPLDRLVSLYFHLRRPYEMRIEMPWATEALATFDDFNKFVPWWVEQRSIHGFGDGNIGILSRGGDWRELDWWLSPSIWLISLGECYKAFGYPHLIRLESYIEDLEAIHPYFAKMPHQKKAGTDTSWRKHYSKANLKLALDSHADEDMELLDYDI